VFLGEFQREPPAAVRVVFRTQYDVTTVRSGYWDVFFKQSILSIFWIIRDHGYVGQASRRRCSSPVEREGHIRQLAAIPTRRGLVDKLTARSLLSHRKYGKEICELHSRCITKRYSGPSGSHATFPVSDDGPLIPLPVTSVGSHLLETLGVDLSLHEPVHRQIFFAAIKRACNSAYIAPCFQFPELTCREHIGGSKPRVKFPK
jgi:hypothetical protein